MNNHRWVIYEHPEDYPDKYVARRFVDGEPTDTCIVNDSVWFIRVVIAHNYPGFFRVSPSVNDPPWVYEVWL
jgi:hypothetical protein